MFKSRSIISYVLLGIITSLSIAYFILPKTETEETPPVLEIASKSRLQGIITGDAVCKIPGIYEFTEDKVNSYLAPNLDVSEKYDLQAGDHLYHASENLSVQQIMNYIVPVAGNKVMFAYYNPIDNATKSFSVYPAIEGQNNITNPEQYIIPANQGFLILSCKDTKIWKVRNEKTPSPSLPMALGTIENGWILFAAPDNFEIVTQALTKIKSIYVQKGPGFDFTKKFPMQSAYSGVSLFPTAIAFSLMESFTKIDLMNDYNMVWIRFEAQGNVAQPANVAPTVNISEAQIGDYSAASGLTSVTFHYKLEGQVVATDKFVYDWDKGVDKIQEIDASTLETGVDLTKIYNFTPGYDYNVVFKLVSSNGTVKSQAEKLITIPSQEPVADQAADPLADVPANPAAPTVSDITTSSAKIAWVKPAIGAGKEIIKYTITAHKGTVCKPAGQENISKLVTVNELNGNLNKVLDGLENGTEYRVFVSATYDGSKWAYGACSPLITLEQVAAAPEPEPVDGKLKGLVYNGLSASKSKIKLQWTSYVPLPDPNKPVSGFAVQSKISSEPNWGETWAYYPGVGITNVEYPKDKSLEEVFERGKNYDFRVAPSTIAPYIDLGKVLSGIKIDYPKVCSNSYICLGGLACESGYSCESSAPNMPGCTVSANGQSINCNSNQQYTCVGEFVCNTGFKCENPLETNIFTGEADPDKGCDNN